MVIIRSEEDYLKMVDVWRDIDEEDEPEQKKYAEQVLENYELIHYPLPYNDN